MVTDNRRHHQRLLHGSEINLEECTNYVTRLGNVGNSRGDGGNKVSGKGYDTQSMDSDRLEKRE